MSFNNLTRMRGDVTRKPINLREEVYNVMSYWASTSLHSTRFPRLAA